MDVELEETPAPAVAPAPERAAPADRAAEAVGGRTSRVAPASAVRSPPGEAASADVEPPTAPPAGSGEPWSLPWAMPMDLGVDGYWKRVAAAGGSPSARPGGGPASPSSASASASERISRMLAGELDAHDRDVGVGAAGPLVTAAHEATSPSIAPDVGTATLEIDADATGLVTAARVVAASGDLPAWDGVAREVVRRMAAKRVRVPAGARGVRARLRIVAERTLPSGETGSVSGGAVPDDVPEMPKQCDGTGSARRCRAGMPLGVTATAHDLSNVAAKASRIVHVQVLGELALGR